MSILLGIVFIVLLYVSGGALGYRLGGGPLAVKIGLAAIVFCVLALVASMISPAFAKLGLGAMFIFPLALGFFRGSKMHSSRAPGDNGPGSQS